MIRRVTRRLAAWVFGAWLLLPASADARPLLKHEQCPAPSYSRLNYWAPTLVRLVNYHRYSGQGVYATDLNPGIPYGYQIIPYKCPAVPPATSAAEYPPYQTQSDTGPASQP